MEIERAALPLAAYTLAQELLLAMIEADVITTSQATALLDRAIDRLRQSPAAANSDASLVLEATRDSL